MEQFGRFHHGACCCEQILQQYVVDKRMTESSDPALCCLHVCLHGRNVCLSTFFIHNSQQNPIPEHSRTRGLLNVFVFHSEAEEIQIHLNTGGMLQLGKTQQNQHVQTHIKQICGETELCSSNSSGQWGVLLSIRPCFSEPQFLTLMK